MVPAGTTPGRGSRRPIRREPGCRSSARRRDCRRAPEARATCCDGAPACPPASAVASSGRPAELRHPMCRRLCGGGLLRGPVARGHSEMTSPQAARRREPASMNGRKVCIGLGCAATSDRGCGRTAGGPQARADRARARARSWSSPVCRGRAMPGAAVFRRYRPSAMSAGRLLRILPNGRNTGRRRRADRRRGRTARCRTGPARGPRQRPLGGRTEPPSAPIVGAVRRDRR